MRASRRNKLLILLAGVFLAGLFATGASTYYYDLIKNNALIKTHLDIRGPTTSTSTLQVQGLSELYGVRKKRVTVNSYNQFTAMGGESVYVIDPANGNLFDLDFPAIYASMSGSTTNGTTVFRDTYFKNGVSVIAFASPPTADNDAYEFTVRKINDTGSSTWQVWVPHTSGVTPSGNLLASYLVGGSGTSLFACASSVSDVPVNEQYTERTYRYNYNSAVSATPVDQRFGS